MSLTNEVVTNLINIFKGCLNILRDNEGLTGEKSLRNMTYLLTLKLIEHRLGVDIDIDNYNYEYSVDDDMVEHHKKRLLELVRFSNLSRENEDNITTILKYLWDDILSQHPATKNIFLKDKGFDIQRQTTFKKIMDKLNTIPDTENDILGAAYEEVIHDIMVGKVFGQFFTPLSVKELMLTLIKPQIHTDGTFDTCGDPTMGTAGFLISYLNYMLKQFKEQNITPNWDFIKTQGLYGKEIEPDTYQLAVSNMLISSGHMFEYLDRGDSIREPITRKFDVIMANPPFGIKGLKHDDIQSSLKNAYLPIKSDNAVSLFIQAIIYMLNINGKCAVVLPDGQDLTSKNASLLAVRKYLMKTCDLKEIISLPAGIFTYTSIKTCVFLFEKKREGCYVLETKIKISKTQKETGRDYIFSETHETTNVKFYDYNPADKVKNLLVEVPIEQIVSNSYSLSYSVYMKDTTEQQYDHDVIVKTLEEVCDIDYGTRIVSKNNLEGIYPVYGSGRAMFSTNTYNREGYNILIGRFALSLECVRFINEKIFLNDSGLSVKPKTSILLHKFIGYYLLHNQCIIYNCARGTAQKNLEMDVFKSIKIPIPSLEKQQEIVKYLDFIHEKANKTSSEKIMELKMLNEFCLNNQKMFGVNEIKTLGEVCTFDIGGTPSRNKSEYYENGTNLWLSVRELNGGYIYDTKEKITNLGVQNSSVKLFQKDTILFSFKLSIGKTAIVGTPLYTNEAIAGIISKNTDLLNNIYLYHYLTRNDFSKLGTGILGNGSLNKKSLEQIKIHIPSLERQQEIVEYCQSNDTLIKQLEKEIENNKILAKQFITSNVKSHILEVPQEQPSDINLEPFKESVESVLQEAVQEEVKEEIQDAAQQSIKPKRTVVKKAKVTKKFVIIQEDES
jgi:type I restriction-modification system DNA methylase subunit